MKLIILLLSLLLISCADNGKNGKNGKNGASCSVESTVSGAIITCADGTTAIILNGEDAPPTPYSVVELINPCGDSSGFDEILFRTHNNELIAHFSSGGLQFLTILTPGNYVTTDSGTCNFTVHPDLKVTDQNGNIWEPL